MSWDHFVWDGLVPIIITKMKNLKLGEIRKDPVLLQITDSIIAGATGNADLNSPPVTLAALGTMMTEADTSITDEAQAREAWETKRTERKDKTRTLRVAVKQYATYAYAILGGDKAKLQALGLDVVEINGLLGTLPAPANVRSKAGMLDGTIGVRWKGVRGRSIYKLECAENADGPWTLAYEGNRVNSVCSGLVSGKEYYFRVLAMGTAGPGEWSDITRTRAK